MQKIQGNIVDIYNRKIFKGAIHIENNRIKEILEEEHEINTFILPGFIDAHIHIESSMLVPTNFAELALQHGTVATISDPHEIANVLGIKGVEYMLENAKNSPLKFHFGAPSCVPATSFETAGAVLDATDVAALLERPDIHYLSEVMNYPAVWNKEEDMMQKIHHAQRLNKVIDGHLPGIYDEGMSTYFAAGISTDHECFTLEEAEAKLKEGVKVIIREGSAAKNFEALSPLIPIYSNQMMFCSDDKHPDDLLEGHINQLCARAVAKGYNVFDVLTMACINPITHYAMNVGSLREGDLADCIVVEDLTHFNVLETYIEGEKVAGKNQPFTSNCAIEIINNFTIQPKIESDFIFSPKQNTLKVIEAKEGFLFTKELIKTIEIQPEFCSDTTQDILKIAVINRYQDQPPAIGFIHGFGLKNGAIASTVAHDSHNIVVVGVDDQSITQAVNELIRLKGGICVVSNNKIDSIGLPIAGLMTDQKGMIIADQYKKLNTITKTNGGTLQAPFMTLSFMALLVIPELKLSDKGLFSAKTFDFTNIYVH